MKFYPHSLRSGRCKFCFSHISWAETFPNRNYVPLDVPIHFKESEFDADGHEIVTLKSTTHFATCTEYGKAAKPVAPAIVQGKLF